jgi:ABC-type branched-subunit amino acid transport system substrate-binding protein
MKKVSIALSFCFSFIAIIGGIWSCSSSGSETEDDAIVIGTIFNDDISEKNRSSLSAISMAVEEINATKVFGKTLKIVNRSAAKNNAIDEDKAEAAAKYLFETEQAVVLISTSSTIAQAVINVTNQPDYQNLLHCSCSANGPMLNMADMGGDQNDSFYRTVVSESFQLDLGTKLVEQNEWHNIGLYRINDIFGAGISLLLQQTAMDMPGYSLVMDRVHPPGAFDVEANKETMDEIIQASVDGVIDVLLLMTLESHSIEIIKYLTDNGYKGPIWVTSSAKRDEIFLSTNLEAWVGSENRIFGIEEDAYGGVNSDDFVENFKTRFEEDPGVNASSAYDCMYAIALAALYAGKDNVSPLGIKESMTKFKETNRLDDEELIGIGADSFVKAATAIESGKQIDYEGASGRLLFDKNGDRPRQGMLVFGLSETGDSWVTTEKYDENLQKIE